MNRSPLFYPMQRGMDAEAGGVADLQTDVMRFMAIISLCLMAIFALVQSIPLVEQVSADDATPAESAKVEPLVAETLVEETSPAAIIKPLPKVQKVVVAEPPKKIVVDKVPVREVRQRPPVPVPASKQQPIEAVSETQPQTAESTQAAAEPEGFTLQFETDDALEQLVARHEVGLYAINEDQVMRMAVENGRAGFWTASLPDEYHEMDARTVPKTIVDALRFAGYSSNTDTHWGVTLPSATAQRLNDFVSEYRGGALIIGASGSLRLEQ